MLENSAKKSYQEWFQKAEEDEQAGRVIIKNGTFFAPACFHFQQMAEKYLKGLLVFYNKKFPKTHDLIHLETLLMDKVSEIKELHNDLEILSRYYIETRYPGDYPQFPQKDAEEALYSAESIKDFALRKTIK